jgi:hypothetical protein
MTYTLFKTWRNYSFDKGAIPGMRATSLEEANGWHRR